MGHDLITADPAAGRVAAMHRHGRRGLATAGGFAVAAVLAAVVPHDTGAWLPLHLFLVGTLTTAIATVTLVLAVTWSAAPAPPATALAAIRWGTAFGAVGVAVGREGQRPALTVIGAVAVAVSLAGVAVALVAVRMRARTTRYHPVIDGYLLAIVAVVVGVGLGAALASGGGSSATREVHLILNVFAFVGVVIASTLPFFVATQARMKRSPWASGGVVRVLVGAIWLAALVAAVAAGQGQRGLAAVALVAVGVGQLAIVVVLPRPGRKQWSWAGPRLIQLAAGIGWWVAATWWFATALGAGERGARALQALAVAGFGQILAASVAYLVPVVRGGGHQRLSAGFARTRSWSGLALGNLAGVTVVVGASRLTVAVLAAWVLDVLARTRAPVPGRGLTPSDP
ncbi:MAG: hypothetical protein ACK5OX_10695 [Desertimonas sp.]